MATFGVDEARKLYVHIKIFKQARVYGEIVMYGGPFKVRCRNCLRWHKVVFRSNDTVALEEDASPAGLG